MYAHLEHVEFKEDKTHLGGSSYKVECSDNITYVVKGVPVAGVEGRIADILGDHPGVVQSYGEHAMNGRVLADGLDCQAYHFTKYWPGAENIEEKMFDPEVLDYATCKWGCRLGERSSCRGAGK